MLIGYMRPYQEDMYCEKQLQILQETGCNQYITEEHSSAKKRAALEQIMEKLQAEDVIVVAKLFAFADSTRHLAELLNHIQKRKAHLLSIREHIDTRQAQGQAFYQNVQALLHFQADMVSENTKKGMYQAQKRGTKVGRPRKLDENIKRAIQMYESRKYSLAQIREETGISKTTLYRYLEN